MKTSARGTLAGAGARDLLCHDVSAIRSTKPIEYGGEIRCRSPGVKIKKEWAIQTCDLIEMKPDEIDLSRFAFLEKAAHELGAIDAKVILASDVFVENRVPLKCRTGCVGYGKKLTCPPYVPTVDEFRKIFSEYNYVLLVKFRSPARAEPDVICSIYRYYGPYAVRSVSPEILETLRVCRNAGSKTYLS
jgi:hypothetical protein